MDTQNIDDLLNERQKTHGDFSTVSRLMCDSSKLFNQELKGEIDPEISLAFTLILLKLSRIAAGNFNHTDHWLDIAGYAKLAAKSIQGKAAE